MANRIEVVERQAEVLKPRQDADGVWRSAPTGAERTVYDILIDGALHATGADRRAAEAEATRLAFMAGLVRGEPDAVTALALWITHGPRS